ncbi:MAG: hypothetical protein R3C68_17275 [Myxococcota bacterium]
MIDWPRKRGMYPLRDVLCLLMWAAMMACAGGGGNPPPSDGDGGDTGGDVGVCNATTCSGCCNNVGQCVLFAAQENALCGWTVTPQLRWI